VINSVELLSEICDETRFHKHVSSSLERLRVGTNDGLFTAHDNEKNWETAHRLLVPAFGPLRIREMFPQMHDIAEQLCLKWYDCLCSNVILLPLPVVITTKVLCGL
jgi:cytochrome P450/NADPH-cytochrome P450 reductase